MPKPKGATDETLTRKVEVFRPGTFRAMNGQDYAFSTEDVAAMADKYDPERAPAPVVVGHPAHDDPAFGWAQGFEINDDGVLVAEIGDLAPEFVAAVEAGRYRKISMKFFPPDAASNPVPGSYYPRHIGFLGGAAPAVSGLKPVEFADAGSDELIEVSFSLSEAAESTASIMRRVREFFIAQFGLEAADQAVPEYHIRWIEEAGKSPEDEPGFTQPTEEKEPVMAKDDAQLQAREAELARRERALMHAENTSFAEELVDANKLLPAQKDGVVALLDELSAGEAAEISFSDGGATKAVRPAQLLKDILSAQPDIVPLGQDVPGEEPASGVAFTSPDGLSVDQVDLELHRKAVSFQSRNPGTDYLAAVQAVQEG